MNIKVCSGDVNMAMRTMLKEICSGRFTRSIITCRNPRKNKYEDTKTTRAGPTGKCLSELRRSTNTHALTLWARKERNIKRRSHLEHLHRSNASIGEDIITESRKNTKPRRPRPTYKEHSIRGRDASHPRKLKPRRRKEEKGKHQKHQQTGQSQEKSGKKQ